MTLMDALRRLAESSIGDMVRAHYAAKYGVCRDSKAPLGGPSPSQICEPCHAARVLSNLGGQQGGEA